MNSGLDLRSAMREPAPESYCRKKWLISEGCRLIKIWQERFFILGCQRTGTTLLRLILESHPDVFCYDETKAYAVLQGLVHDDSPRTRLKGFKIPRWTEQMNFPVLYDEGLDRPCKNPYRGEKILYLHRDVRDTLTSMVR